MVTVPAISAAERERLLTNYPEVFHRSFMQRYGLAIGTAITLVYLTICFFAFNVGPGLHGGPLGPRLGLSAGLVFLACAAAPALRSGRHGAGAVVQPRPVSRRLQHRLAAADCEWRLHGDL
jgi:hypothetical protein